MCEDLLHLYLFNPVTWIEQSLLLFFLSCGAATCVTRVFILDVNERVVQVVATIIILVIHQLEVFFIRRVIVTVTLVVLVDVLFQSYQGFKGSLGLSWR